MAPEADPCCSVTLIVVGETLPDEIPAVFELHPDRVWHKGKPKSVPKPDGSKIILETLHETSGWKFFIPERFRHADLQEQLNHWLKFISNCETELNRLRVSGAEVSLNIYVNSLQAVTLKPSELVQLGQCGVELDWNFYP